MAPVDAEARPRRDGARPEAENDVVASTRVERVPVEVRGLFESLVQSPDPVFATKG